MENHKEDILHKKNTQREADNVTEEVVHEKLFVTKVKNQEI